MKLGELKSEIRTMKGNPKAPVVLPNGTTIYVFVQKTSILPELDSVYGARNTETDLRLSSGGVLIPEGSAMWDGDAADEPADIGPSLLDLMGPSTDELDDLIG